MSLSRRQVLRMVGGGSLAGLLLRDEAAAASGGIEIEMSGTKDGSRVWFDPAGVFARPGDTIRWVNRDAGNAHTATAYHPANDDHPPRIPPSAEPWSSGYLLPGESFERRLTAPGVYDYYCVPHELAGMVGRIVVAEEGDPAPPAADGIPVPGIAQDPFPPVGRIMREGSVRQR